ASGNFDGDLIHVHQHTGSPLTDADLLHLEADNSGVVPLRSISGGDTNAVFVLGLVQMDSLDVSGVARIDGNITTSGTVDGVDLAAFNTDVAADSAAQNAAKDSVGEWDNRSYPDASVTAKGIASFNGGDFSDASGVITIDNDGHLHTGISISGLGSADISGLDSTNIATNSLSMTGDLHTFTKAELEGQSSDVADYAEADGDTWTGVHDMGGATSLEIPNSKNPTTDAKGEIAIDNNNGIRYYDSALAAQVVQPSLCTFQWGVDQPDILENDSVQVMDVLTDLYPFGIKLVSLGMKHKQPFAYSVTFWEYTHVCADSGTESQLEGAIATGATECTAEDDGTLTDSDIAAGSVIKVLLPATDVPDLTLWGTFYVKTGD
ncbi:hypothetical protein KAR91_14590, partial [Candidatus Pacearchaeota archaeon]|nr:hypothetical protein [Candidatus Pacearchaeota archaeon]